VDVPVNGDLRVFNLDNVRTNVYMTQEGNKEEDNFLFSCPPLDPYRSTRLQHLYVPYYAVGGTFDTSIVLISTNTPFEPGGVDGNGDQIPQTTHVRMDFYDSDGNYLFNKEKDVNNTARYEIFLSDEAIMGIDRFDPNIYTGSIVISVDRDNVCGVYAYTMWNTYEETDDPIPPFTHVRNMTVDELPLTEDATQTVLFPYTINIEPFHTSYVLYNPGDQALTVRLDLYDPSGALVGSSIEDISIPSHGQFIFFMGDPDIFGEVPGLDNFVGYMRAQSTSGSRFFGRSIQSSPEMLAIIPTM